MHKTMFAAVLALAVTACQPKPQSTEPASSQAASAVPAPVLSADEQGLGTPEAFIVAIYAHYADSATDADWNWTANDGADYFDPDLVALMKEDARLNEGYVGAIDAMPFCDCQDYNALKADIRGETATADHARIVATVREKNASAGGRFVYDLVRLQGRWRIADMHTPTVPSLKQLLIRSNAEAAKAASSTAAS